MARIEIGPEGPEPRCSGCGEAMYVLHHLLDSRIREPYGPDAARRGSAARAVAAFAARHACCPEPRREVTAAGIAVTDRRQR